jgi:hypothetical protein
MFHRSLTDAGGQKNRVDDEKSFGAENAIGAEEVTGAENIRGRENISGAENKSPKLEEGLDEQQLTRAARAISNAADELLAAAKILERAGWAAAQVKDAKGHPIELWAKDEALQALADRLNGIAAEITAEAEP